MTTTTPKNPMARVMGLRDFRLLFGGTATSRLGDQFYLIAGPWLVLTLTNDPLALGIVLALEGLPRALFMLVGGAVTDRFSPRRVMLVSDISRFALTALMTIVVFTGSVQMWMVYLFGLGGGLVAGFAIPASNSIVPMLVEEQDLPAGNSLIMGITQLIGFVGPTLAGILIGGFAKSNLGVALAFGIDAATFAVSALCLWLMRSGQRSATAGATQQESVWVAIGVGLKYMWTNQALRMLLLVLACINFLVVGPLLVGIPVLANQRLPEGAAAYGLLMSAMAGGSLLGFILAGTLRRPGGNQMRLIILGLFVWFGVVVGLLAFSTSTWIDFGLLFLFGLGNGYLDITVITWMQTRTPKDLLGRMMSLITLASAGLLPVSSAIAGAVSKWNLDLLLVTAGALTVLATVWTAFQPGLKMFSESLSVAPASDLNASVASGK